MPGGKSKIYCGLAGWRATEGAEPLSRSVPSGLPISRAFLAVVLVRRWFQKASDNGPWCYESLSGLGQIERVCRIPM